MSSRWLAVIIALGLATLASAADAAIRPFVLAGATAIRTEKTDLDEMLDEYTIQEDSKGWEVGGGLRLVSATGESGGADHGGVPSWGERAIEMRLRLTVNGGSLPDVNFSGQRSSGFSYPPRSFSVTSRETFDYISWALGGFFSARVYRGAGFYLGPVVQSVSYEADRSWTGPTDCTQCGPGGDKATDRYGAFEAGLHYTLRRLPLRLEGWWIPKRVNLSTTHIVRSDNYQANFAAFKESMGGRVSWEF